MRAVPSADSRATLAGIDETLRCLPVVVVKTNEKRELISDIWGKRGATYGEKGVCVFLRSAAARTGAPR